MVPGEFIAKGGRIGLIGIDHASGNSATVVALVRNGISSTGEDTYEILSVAPSRIEPPPFPDPKEFEPEPEQRKKSRQQQQRELPKFLRGHKRG